MYIYDAELKEHLELDNRRRFNERECLFKYFGNKMSIIRTDEGQMSSLAKGNGYFIIPPQYSFPACNNV